MTRVMKRQLEEELNFENKPDIRPARLSAPPPAQPSPAREEHDDSYSPAHAADSVGTGVDTDPGDDREPGGDTAQVARNDAASPVDPDDDAGTKKSQ
jgi:hypothetical protein